MITLPDHWEIISPDTFDGHFDDGRDYEKQSYVRKDGKARTYHNEHEEGTDCEFAISWDGDGDCCGSLEEAVKLADRYVEAYDL